MNDKSLSKFLSLVLRHAPETIDLELDSEGWANCSELIAAANLKGKDFDLEQLKRVVAESDKQRFGFSSDGLFIRANQGHSVEVDLKLQQLTPPAVLFHGTVERFLESIRRTGLEKGKRHHVHLSADRSTADIVGKRRGDAIVLTIDAAAMVHRGHHFFQSNNGVWLCDHIPPDFISFPANI